MEWSIITKTTNGLTLSKVAYPSRAEAAKRLPKSVNIGRDQANCCYIVYGSSNSK